MAKWNEIEAGMTVKVNDIEIKIAQIRRDPMFGTIEIKGETEQVENEVMSLPADTDFEIIEDETQHESFSDWLDGFRTRLNLTGMECYEIRQRGLIEAYSPHAKIARLQDQEKRAKGHDIVKWRALG